MRTLKFMLLPILVCFGALPAIAQHGHGSLPLPTGAGELISALPEAPQPAEDAALPPDATTRNTTTVERTVPAKRFAKSINPDETTKVMSGKEKLAFSFVEQATAYSGASILVSAGWEQLLNSDPKYGTNAEAFGKRLGVAAIRQTSQSVFTDGVFATVFHQDPRYYRMGRRGHFWDRSKYVIEHVVVTQQDSGKAAPNYSLLLGYASASALTMAYYPAASNSFSNAAEGYGFSVLANVGGNAVHEFWPDVVRFLHHDHD